MEISTSMSIANSMKDYLYKRLEAFPPKRILEFGTGAGVATEILAEFAPVVTFENLPEWHRFSSNRLSHLKNVSLVLGYDPKMVYWIFDFVFVDGPKGSEPRIEMLRAFWDKIESGAIIVVDDSNQRGLRAGFKQMQEEGLLASYHVNNTDRGIGELVKA